jgi:hypothetical protein
MKSFNWSLFLGSCVIGIAIIIAGILISGNLPQTPVIPSSLSVSTSDVSTQPREFMPEYEAAGFLMIGINDFDAFVDSGQLDGTFAVIEGNRVFSKEKLTQWLDSQF